MTAPLVQVYETHVVHVDAAGGTPQTLEAAIRAAVLAYFRTRIGMAERHGDPELADEDDTMLYVYVDTRGVLGTDAAREAFRKRLDAFHEELNGREGQDGIVYVTHLVVEFDRKPTVGAPLPEGPNDVVDPLRRSLRRASIRVASALLRGATPEGETRAKVAAAVAWLSGSADDPTLTKMPRQLADSLASFGIAAQEKALSAAVMAWADAHDAGDTEARFEAAARLAGALGADADDERRLQAEDKALAMFQLPAFDVTYVDHAHFARIAHRIGLRLAERVGAAFEHERTVAIDPALRRLGSEGDAHAFLRAFGATMQKVAAGATGDTERAHAVRDICVRAWSAFEPVALFALVTIRDDEVMRALGRRLLQDALVEFTAVLGRTAQRHDDEDAPVSLPFWPFDKEQLAKDDSAAVRVDFARAALMLSELTKTPGRPAELLAKLDLIRARITAAAGNPVMGSMARTTGLEHAAFAMRLGALAGVDPGTIAKAAEEGSLAKVPGLAAGLEGKLGPTTPVKAAPQPRPRGPVPAVSSAPPPIPTNAPRGWIILAVILGLGLFLKLSCG